MENYLMIITPTSAHDEPIWTFKNENGLFIDLLGQKAKELESMVYGSIVPESYSIENFPKSEYLVIYSLKNGKTVLSIVLEINDYVEDVFNKEAKTIHAHKLPYLHKLPIVKRLLEHNLEQLRSQFKP